MYRVIPLGAPYIAFLASHRGFAWPQPALLATQSLLRSKSSPSVLGRAVAASRLTHVRAFDDAKRR